MHADDLSVAEQAMIEEWTRAAFDFAVARRYVTPPWCPSDDLYGLLLDLYLFGMTPADAAEAVFATYH